MASTCADCFDDAEYELGSESEQAEVCREHLNENLKRMLDEGAGYVQVSEVVAVEDATEQEGS